ncbi:MAG: rRNA maturation RNase YbeY [Candidatus Sungbacteria bacterium GWC2_49_10]|uniref:Endoribonuclease YbeY n=2 Tax=Parcubacteria group TaxID=1794811 RepID=A0A0G1WS67_9BACT|nr:MAG: putative rRNA maturation factor [Parcubacteria group bacterium GW2011_GWB1_50_9]KKW21693.1 MAG: putative rRNA maturation factor [Candidatus Adlerbacteria bacterium GW2011_GWC1_50_9]KKW33723.1 MAG: putative rRNA maturation factor [Parcubacteria group bacterium GW2011_GWA1_53_13]OGZ94708.1 MAG: rRNA maturation RNase YbeY [Candidatus Sungbacteria bacterium GWC2_49_10]
MIPAYVSFFRRRFPVDLRAELPRMIQVIPVSSARSRVLNTVYRGRAKAANVLSFRYGKEYGEIIICPKVIRREAHNAGLDVRFQTARMVLHGMIHLSGLHHEESEGADGKTLWLEARLLDAVRQQRGRAIRVSSPRA